jgi:hypothetical protein
MARTESNRYGGHVATIYATARAYLPVQYYALTPMRLDVPTHAKYKC